MDIARRALTVRGITREYGIGWDRLAGAIRSGELPASRLGERQFTVLRDDLEAWIRRHQVAPVAGHEVRQ